MVGFVVWCGVGVEYVQVVVQVGQIGSDLCCVVLYCEGVVGEVWQLGDVGVVWQYYGVGQLWVCMCFVVVGLQLGDEGCVFVVLVVYLQYQWWFVVVGGYYCIGLCWLVVLQCCGQLGGMCVVGGWFGIQMSDVCVVFVLLVV